jgi:hypothetical protein
MHNNKQLIKDLRKWCADWENTVPRNLGVYDSGSEFETDAYRLITDAVMALKNIENQGKLDIDTLDLYAWLVELDQVRRAVLPSDTRNDLRKAIDQCAGLIKEKNNAT